MAEKSHRVAYIRGGPQDESGPEMMDAAMKVLGVLFEANGGPAVQFVPVAAGAHCIAQDGQPMPRESLEKILELGVVFKAPTKSMENEKIAASLLLRHELNTYASLNEMRSYPGLRTALKPNIDIVLVRDNAEGMFKANTVYPSKDMTIDLRIMTRDSARRIAKVAFALARTRRKKIAVCAFPTAIHSDHIFIEGCEEIARAHPDVEFWVRKVDAFAGTAVSDPEQYDVILAPNEWGSIMTDLFAATCGSVGLVARANIGDSTACFEPIHGTAPGKAGKGTVNPISQVMAGKMLIEWLGRRFDDAVATRAASRLEQAVRAVLSTGKVLTVDLGGSARTEDVVSALGTEIRRLCA